MKRPTTGPWNGTKQHILERSLKSQSAMEYLMTYGWAILIIAIVMVAMFQLGIFNPSEPRVSAGACEVFHGSDVGECQGVWPQFVADLNTGGWVYGPMGTYFGQNNQLTISAWAYLTSSTSGPVYGVTSNAGVGAGWCMPFLSDNGVVVTGWIWGISAMSYTTSGGWHQLVISYTPSGSGQEIFYVDGKQEGTGTGEYSPSGQYDYWDTNNGCQTQYTNGAAVFSGQLANVQIYNTSLSQAEITALYHEGIGGAPVDPNHIVGWWPLNGNAQDYSGNGNNGAATAVTYTSAWTSGYTQP